MPAEVEVEQDLDLLQPVLLQPEEVRATLVVMQITLLPVLVAVAVAVAILEVLLFQAEMAVLVLLF